MSRRRAGAPAAEPRSAAAAILDRVLAGRLPAGAPLAAAAAGLAERDRAFLRELVLGTLRWVRRLDHVIEAASSRRLQRIDRPLLAPLRVGAYQILFLDRIPAHAAVNAAVAEARRRSGRGGAGFVNAVLRRIADAPAVESWPVRESDPARRLGIETSHPDLLVGRWLGRFGEERTRRLLDADNRPGGLHLLAFGDRGGRAALGEALAAEGVETAPSPISPLGLRVRAGRPLATAAWRRGDLYVQDEAGQAAALVPPPRPEETVLDAAAAPGGKSFALLGREPSARIVAADRSLPRLRLLRANLRRLGRRLPIVAADGLGPPFEGPFDRVLLDVPCAGTGTLRKHPELKWRISEAELERLAGQALEMLAAAAPLVRSGGLLIHLSCSLEEEENEEVVARFLAASPGFEPVSLADLLPPEVAGGALDPERPGRWQLLTTPEHDGFTVHVLRRGRSRRAMA